MSSEATLLDQFGRPVQLVATENGMRFEVIGEALPTSPGTPRVYVDPNGGGKPHGDFPVKHPSSGPVSGQPPAPQSVSPTDNATEGRVYTMTTPGPKPAAVEYAKRSAQVLEGYVEGLLEPMIEAAKLAADGWKNIVTEPLDTAKAVAWGAKELGGMAFDGWRQIVSDPAQALDAFVWAGKEALAKANDILAGNPKEAGKLVGEFVGVLAPVGATKVIKGKPKVEPAQKPKAAPNTGATVLKKKPPPDGYKSYKTDGIKERPGSSPEGRRLVKEYMDLGYSEPDAIKKARDLMETGSNLPQANPTEIGDRLYKVVPEGNMPGPKSEFWATREQIQWLEGLSRDQIANRLGLPLESQQAACFEVVEIKAMHPTTTFSSKIAPTTQNGWSQTGGGVQTLVTDRAAFTPPVKTGTKLP